MRPARRTGHTSATPARRPQRLAGRRLERARLVAARARTASGAPAGSPRDARRRNVALGGRDAERAARDLQLAHHDQQRGVEDLAAA